MATQVLLLLFSMCFMGAYASKELAHSPVDTHDGTASPAITIKLISWDLGGSMLDVSILGMMCSIGPLDCIRYHIGYTYGQDQLQNKLFDTLERCFGRQSCPYDLRSYHTAHRPLPAIMCRWLAGMIEDRSELLEELDKRMLVLYEHGYFINELEYRLVKNALHHMFTPTTLIKHTYIVKEAYDIATAVHAKKRCSQTIFSNWDLWSYPLLKESLVGKELAKLFKWDLAIISGSLKQLKPHSVIFDTLCQFWNIQPHECLIIDDQEENVRAARRYGFHALCVVDKNFKEVIRFLQANNLL